MYWLSKPQEELWGRANLLPITHFPCAVGTTNLGDDIQSEAIRLWLSTPDYEPEWCLRDGSQGWTGVVPLCGWYNRCPKPSKAQWVVIGFHLRNPKGADFDALRRAVAEQGFPAGCRDTHTVDILRRNDIEAEFSGCVTQTLPDSPYKAPTLKLAVEAEPPNEKWVRSTHRIPELKHLHPEARLAIARSQLRLLGAAEAVVTTKLHAYLPALAMGCPVVKVSAGMKPFNPERWSGYHPSHTEAS